MGVKSLGKLLGAAAKRLDAPEAALCQVPRVTVTGGGEVCVENHKGLLGYTRQQVEVPGGRIHVRVLGQELELLHMTPEVLVIQGAVYAVELEQRGGEG